MKQLLILLALLLSLTAFSQKKQAQDSINLFVSFYAKGRAITGDNDFGNGILRYAKFPDNKQLIADIIRFQPRLKTFNSITILSVTRLSLDEAKQFFKK